MSRSSFRPRPMRLLAVAVAGVTLLGGATLSSLPASADPTPALGPTVSRTELPPTGYEVTIRYQNAGATRVQIAPEMSFSDPALITGPSAAESKPGSQWEPGDVPAIKLAGDGAGWPV